MFTGWLGLLGHWNVLLWRILHGGGMIGSNEEMKVQQNVLEGFCVSPGPVLSTVFRVWTWHSVNLLDLGKCREEVECSMWWCWRNSASSSNTKGWSLSVESRDGGPYCEMSLSKCAHRDWADLVETLHKKGTCWIDCRLVHTPYPCGEVIHHILLPSGMSLGSIGCAGGEALCLVQMVHQQM